MVAACAQSRWTDLPPDLLGLVLSRVLSHADRVRLRAVCRAWRSGAGTVQHLLPPLLPWAALRDGSFFSLPDGAVHRMPMFVRENVSHRVSTGGMLFIVDHDGRCSLMHPQSGDTTTQDVSLIVIGDCLYSLRLGDEIRKVVMADHFLAVRNSMSHLTVYARGGAKSVGVGVGWVGPGNYRDAADIALFQGKLYVLTTANIIPQEYGLYVLDITASDGQGGISITSVQCISCTKIPRDLSSPSSLRQYRFYLLVSGDRLLMVDQTIQRRYPDQVREPSRFLVLEAADLNGYAPRWSKVDTLTGHALFLSEGCSESLPIGGDSGAREDCIYFMSECYPVGCYNYDDLQLECGVYNMSEETVKPLLPPSKALAKTRDGPWPPTWLFPDGT